MKILLAHMWMVIGGAETHVLELARALAALGHDVTVASNGGVYVNELEEAGVRHFTVPLHSKSPANMIRSYRRLKKLVKKERFDIVHAHSRIPAFVCGTLSKRMGFRFVTSTHAVFKVSPLLARLSDWGEHTFAVSCDIKQYLMDNYKTPSDNITLTINGIDTERFSVSSDTGDTKARLGLKNDAFRVVYVSRIDNETAMPGFLLCDAAKRLADAIPELEIVIVGGGTAFDKLSERADAVNRDVGYAAVRMLGPRTDVADIVSCADAFVGVSRAALEAMSLEVPVVLAGQEGYIGVLDSGVMPLAKLTNFTCRGERLPDAEAIEKDIIAIYNMTDGERSALGALGREQVLENYSVSKMAEDHIAVYRRLTPYRKYKHGDIIISGYYGFRNIGDDSLLSSMISGIKEHIPDAKITVLSKHPKKLAKIAGVRTINRFNIPAVALEMRKARLLISGGGSLLQDGTSKKSLYYYVFIMRMAKHFGLKLMLYANGLGPLGAEATRIASADAISSADYVSFREMASYELARELNVSGDIKVTADPAFLLEATHELWKMHIINREEISGEYFIVSVKDGNNFDGAPTGVDTVAVLAKDIREISEKYSITPLFIPMYPDRDTDITKRIAAMAGVGRVVCNLTAGELCGLLGDARFSVGTRLHMLIFSASMGVPSIGISYDPKIDAFLDYIGGEDALDIRNLREGELTLAADKLMADYESVCVRLKDTAQKMRSLARLDCAAVKVLLDNKNH